MGAACCAHARRRPPLVARRALRPSPGRVGAADRDHRLHRRRVAGASASGSRCLSGRTTKDDEDVSIRLLADIRDCFALHPRVARVQTAELLEYLNSLDTSPWAGWHGGRGLSGQALAARLRGFRIRPHDPARYGDRAGVKGYDRAAFEDAWARLLPPGGVYDVEDVDDFSRQTNGPDSARETAPLNTSYASSTTSTPRTETPMNKGESRVDDRVEVAVDVPSAPARTSTMADEIDEFAARIIDLDFTKSLPLQDVRHSHFRPLLSRQRSAN